MDEVVQSLGCWNVISFKVNWGGSDSLCLNREELERNGI